MPPWRHDPTPGLPGANASGWLRELDQGRGSRWLAGVVVVVALAVGLSAGGVLGSRGAALRSVAGEQRAAARPSPLRDLNGPVGELAGLDPLFFVDDRGGAWRQNADGSRRQDLGGLPDLAGRRASSDRQELNPLQGAPPAPGGGDIVPGGDRAYLVLPDGTPAVERFADARPRRLVPQGWTPAGPWYRSRDASTVATCGFKQKRGSSTIDQVRTWIVDGDGRQLATLPGCVYDVAADGSAALVSEPAAAAAGGAVREVKGSFAFQGTQRGSDVVTRGLRLWRRSGGFRPVLSRSEVLRAFRQVQPEVDPRSLAVTGAALSPDGAQAFVLVQDLLKTLTDRPPESVALLLVDLRTRRAQVLPARFPGTGIWAPTGGYVSFGPSDTVLFNPPGGSAPTLLYVFGTAGGPVTDVSVSPDGSWLLLTGERWTFVRLDDPAVRVSYRAPGRFAGWATGAGR